MTSTGSLIHRHFSASQELLQQSSDSVGVSTNPSFFTPTPLDIHHSLDEVRQMAEFQPPHPNALEELLKLPFFQSLSKLMNQLLSQNLQHFISWLRHLLPSHAGHLPENAREIFTGGILLILGLLALYALYIMLGWVLEAQNKKASKTEMSTRLFEESPLLSAAQHYQNAQQASAQQHYEIALRQLYMASLCLLDERAWVPYETTRSNWEYWEALHQAVLSVQPHPPFSPSSPSPLQELSEVPPAFRRLAQQFEAMQYGKHPVASSQFWQSEADYQQIEQGLAPHA